MQYKQTCRKKAPSYKSKAVDILYENMVFYNHKASELIVQIMEIINTGKIARGDLLVQLTKMQNKYKELAIDCAGKLAPYQTPRLESVEVKKTTVHRFVIKAPNVITDTSKWFKAIGVPQLAPPTDTRGIEAPLNNHQIPDLEVIDKNNGEELFQLMDEARQ